MAYYAVEYVFTPDKRHLPVRPAHRAFLTELQVAGSLVLSGPFTSDTGGLLVFRADDEAELRRLLDRDPYHEAAVLGGVRIEEWSPVLGYLAEHLKD
ncbi:YciI family protein [Kitasatospora sp. NPDC096077]|uniref:YciI family protein n=1 Tax=Kitasatospora sp. NPDC096077 TaxID=3155544 RepID=UPI003333F9E8